MSYVILVTWAILYYFANDTSCEEATIVTRTEYGPVRGYIKESSPGYYHVSYKGIPYAEQPINDLRFQPLQPPKHWTEVYDAKVEGPICMQPDILYGPLMQPHGMSEACMYVNVHTPLDNTVELKPVLVYIHGGGFNLGSGDSDIYDPEYFVDHGIIVVTFNYRLGVLGFLSMGIPETPGNLGLKDMVFLLKWVQRNIVYFGGDPNNVTVGGQSAGAAASHLLALSPMSRGLFQKAIYQSGTGISSFVNTSPMHAETVGKQFASLLNISSDEPRVIYDKLRRANINDLKVASQKISEIYGILTFGTVVETVYDGVEPFLPEDPKRIILQKKSHDIPTLMGFTDNEGISFYECFKKSNIDKIIKNQRAFVIPHDMVQSASKKMFHNIMNFICDKYFSSHDLLNSFLTFMSIVSFQYPTIRLARLHSLYHSNDTYMYEFAQESDLNFFKNIVSGRKFRGAAHIDDLGYIFKCNACNYTIKPGSQEEMYKDRMVTLFANFIKTGNPTSTTDGLINITWPPVDEYDLPYMRIGHDLSIETNPYPDMVKTLDKLYNYLENGESLNI